MFNPYLEAKIQEITVQCEKEEFVELLENLDQNETNFDYNTGKTLADPLPFYRFIFKQRIQGPSLWSGPSG